MYGDSYPLTPSGGSGSGTYYTDIRLTADTEDNAVGTSIATWRPRVAITITGVSMWMSTAPTGSVATVDINEAGVSILSTKLTIDAGELTSTTAATPAVVSDASIAADALVTFDFDGVGSSVPGKGTVVTIAWTET